jgi:hypothetical protein
MRVSAYVNLASHLPGLGGAGVNLARYHWRERGKKPRL